MSSDDSSAILNYHLSQLLGQDDYWKRELKDEQVHHVLYHLGPSIMRWLKMNEILPFLSKWHVLIATEMYRVETTRPTRQASVLINFLMNKGTAGIELLYVSLMESTKQSGGVPSHYQLAEELKKLVQAELGITASSGQAAVSSTHQQQKSLHSYVKKLYQIPLDADSAQAFIASLGLSAADFRIPPTSFQAVCQCWLSQSSAPGDMDQLVEALVSTRGLGRHTSCLCSPVSSVLVEVRSFLLSLGERWVELARFLGFSEEEVGAITEAHASSIEQQVVEFLKLWQLPECGQRTLPLMHKLKALAGIVEPRNASKRLADRPDAQPVNWQYETLSRNSPMIIKALADNKLTEHLADLLKARQMIGDVVYARATTTHGPNVTEYTRMKSLVTAIQTSTGANPQRYHDFIEVLTSDGIRPDAEAALAYLPALQDELGITVSSDPSSTHQQRQVQAELGITVPSDPAASDPAAAVSSTHQQRQANNLQGFQAFDDQPEDVLLL